MLKRSALKELWNYMKTRKKFWLAPVLIVFLILSFLIVLTQTSVIAPFIYAIF